MKLTSKAKTSTQPVMFVIFLNFTKTVPLNCNAEYVGGSANSARPFQLGEGSEEYAVISRNFRRAVAVPGGRDS